MKDALADHCGVIVRSTVEEGASDIADPILGVVPPAGDGVEVNLNNQARAPPREQA